MLAARALGAAVAAAEPLRAASGAVGALSPNPEKAYGQAAKAVESAAHVVVEPASAKATLGTMRGAMRASPGAFEVAIPGPGGLGDVAPVIGLMTLLWEGQTARHGGKGPA